jgi:hypothetical protein
VACRGRGSIPRVDLTEVQGVPVVDHHCGARRWYFSGHVGVGFDSRGRPYRSSRSARRGSRRGSSLWSKEMVF